MHETAERHDPMPNATCRAERNHGHMDDATHVCRWLAHADTTHSCKCGYMWDGGEPTFDDRVRLGFAPALVQALKGQEAEGEIIRLRNRTRALEANGAELLARAEFAEGQLSALRAHETRWQAEHAEVERLRADLADVHHDLKLVVGDAYTTAASAAFEVMRRLAATSAERDALKAAILDIDAHATPYGDIPDEPGYVGTYLLTAGALHRALGKVGHSAPKCQAEAIVAGAKALAEQWIGNQDAGTIGDSIRADAGRQILAHLRALDGAHSPGDAERIADEKPTGVHAFEQNPAATQISVCICGLWWDHHMHGADPCGCDACRTPETTPDAPTEETDR